MLRRVPHSAAEAAAGPGLGSGPGRRAGAGDGGGAAGGPALRGTGAGAGGSARTRPRAALSPVRFVGVRGLGARPVRPLRDLQLRAEAQPHAQTDIPGGAGLALRRGPFCCPAELE